ALRRYPELQKLALVSPVSTSELGRFEARVTPHTVQPVTSTSARSLTSTPAAGRSLAAASLKSPKSVQLAPGSGLHIAPAGNRSLYCLAAVELTRAPLPRARPGIDYCPLTHGLLASRDSGASVYALGAAGHARGIAVNTPVYRGNLPPSGFPSR